MISQDKLYDPIRQLSVKATQEEYVRQKILQLMFEKGYPPSLLCVEKSLAELCQYCVEKVPSRRLDIVCFSKKAHAPLLIVECKAHRLDQKAFDQLMSYNFFIRAPFIALANQDHIFTGWYDSAQKEYRFVPQLLLYSELMHALS